MSTDLRDILSLLPPCVADSIVEYNIKEDRIIDFILDVGRPIRIRTIDGSFILNTKVTPEIYVNLLNGRTVRNNLNRIGIENTLHRIGIIHDLNGEVVGA